MAKTLVIHPEDRSTDFLKPIYSDISGATIISSGTKHQVNESIKTHDRIIMMGHGSPWGLFSIGKFNTPGGFIIDNTTVSLLREKENIFIWCNADKFVNFHKLNGFYSGMFISEVSEAMYCGLVNTPQDMVDDSNNTFAQILGSIINKSLNEVYEYTKQQYDILAHNNKIALYNNERLYLK